MLARARILSLAVLALCIAPAGAVAQEPQPTPDGRIIAPGVTVAGIDLSGQTVDQAATNLDLTLRGVLEAPVDVASGGKSFQLLAAEAKVTFDAARTAKRAYYFGRDKGPGAVAPAVTFSKKAVVAFTERIDKAISVRPRNAKVKITLRRVKLTKGRAGQTINEHELARQINRALVDPTFPRAFTAAVVRDRPDVTTAAVRKKNRTVVTVDRTTFKLRLFKGLRRNKIYTIAIGAAGYDTPSGQFAIQSKQVNPAWHVPRSPWAGSMQGQVVPGGAPGNPLKARWLGVNGAVGIHGTAEEWSMGSRASHGCIRMRVRDVIDLFPRVPLGAPVLIK
jgi:lipoprotein-anchoring transpeptidase ErfK/SrfK